MSKKILFSVIQIGIVVLLIPAVLLLLSAVFPDEVRRGLWNSLLGALNDVPLTGSVLGLVESFYTMTQTADGYLLFFADMLHHIGACVLEATIVGMFIHALRELSVIFIPGVPAVAIMLGAFAGVFAVKLTEGLPVQVRFVIMLALVAVNIVLIFVTEPSVDGGEPANKAKKVIDTVMLGFQSIIAGFSLFFTACVLWLFVNKPADFNMIFVMWIMPAFVLSLMFLLDYSVATAKTHSFV